MVQVSIGGANAKSYRVTVPGLVLGASIGPVGQDRITLMSTELQAIKQLISVIKGELGL